MNDIFKPIDISHKPKRFQQDNLSKVTAVSGPAESITPTIENAIKFFEESDNQLFLSTAGWLRDYLVIRNSAKKNKKE